MPRRLLQGVQLLLMHRGRGRWCLWCLQMLMMIMIVCCWYRRIICIICITARKEAPCSIAAVGVGGPAVGGGERGRKESFWKEARNRQRLRWRSPLVPEPVARISCSCCRRWMQQRRTTEAARMMGTSTTPTTCREKIEYLYQAAGGAFSR